MAIAHLQGRNAVDARQAQLARRYEVKAQRAGRRLAQLIATVRHLRRQRR